MADQSKQTQNPWFGAEQSARVKMDSTVSLITEKFVIETPSLMKPQSLSMNSDGELGVIGRAFSAAGAAFLSAVLVNPLDVAKGVWLCCSFAYSSWSCMLV